MLMGAIYIVARIKNLPAEPWHGFGEIVAGGKEAGWGLFLIIIILGGIYGGVFTPTEAAAVAAVYSFFVALFIYRDMGPMKDLPWIQDTIAKRANVGFKALVYAVAFFFVWMILSFFVTGGMGWRHLQPGELSVGVDLASRSCILSPMRRGATAFNSSTFLAIWSRSLPIWRRNLWHDRPRFRCRACFSMTRPARCWSMPPRRRSC